MRQLINYFLNKFNKQHLSSTEIEKRYNTCENCENFWHQVKVCTICRCYMPAKTKIKKARCPINKW